MNQTIIPKTKPTSKFGKKTRQFSVRLPEETIERIKKEQIDTGQILYDVIERGKSPYKEDMPHDIGPPLMRKLVTLMIKNKIVAPDGYFSLPEIEVIKKVAEGKL